ncbi:MAG: hypothetical protein C5B43_01225 [Verrucomicrobia bacterium]|nr:MAG: hypothetical protein C5B43_01225 [Verrucomicrobiota bacterium]
MSKKPDNSVGLDDHPFGKDHPGEHKKIFKQLESSEKHEKNALKNLKNHFKKDLIATPKFRKVMAEYGSGKLKTSSGQQVNSPKQAEAIAASESGQSYNQKTRKESKYDRYGVRRKNA